MAILNDGRRQVALSWKALINQCAEEFNFDLKTEIDTEGMSYPDIATEIAKLISKKETITYVAGVKRLKEKIAELTSWYPDQEARLKYGNILETFDPSWIITTNYDLILECLLTGKCLSLGPNDQLIAPKSLIPIYHLHGLRTNPDSIIISQEDYISLFRPNQYRQQKLSLSIKESTTLIIGYGLGDVNVLTAVDWTNNVYNNQRINYPHDIIQLFYCDKPKVDAYRDRNNILILEFNNMESILTEIADAIINDRIEFRKTDAELDEMNAIFQNPTVEDVEAFIDDEKFRQSVIESISKNDVKLISGFLELFSKSIDETWERSKPYNAFYAYNENLIILLDVLQNIDLSIIPPALLESVAYNLDQVSYYVGRAAGKSRDAYSTWDTRKDKIPKETLLELKNIARVKSYYRLNELLEKL